MQDEVSAEAYQEALGEIDNSLSQLNKGQIMELK
jgi:hypothetical protein